MTFLREQFICCLILYHSLVELLLNVLASLITLQLTRLLARFLPCTLVPHSPHFQHPTSPLPPSELSCSGSTLGHPSYLNLDGARCSLRFLWPLRSVTLKQSLGISSFNSGSSCNIFSCFLMHALILGNSGS